MHRFTDFQPQLADSKYGPEPSLFDIIERYYIAQHVEWNGTAEANPSAAAKTYIDAWLALERADRDRRLADIKLAWSKINAATEVERIQQHEELKAILQRFDDLANLWGDESGFHQCRDRLRKIVEHPT